MANQIENVLPAKPSSKTPNKTTQGYSFISNFHSTETTEEIQVMVTSTKKNQSSNLFSFNKLQIKT